MFQDIEMHKDILDKNPKHRKQKQKQKNGIHQTKKHPQSKENNQQSEETNCGMPENT
jgi:hypothetical protein